MINDEDMEYQLSALALQEISLKRELVSIGQAMGIHLLGDWEASVEEYLLDLQMGLESLNADPQTDEERQEIFALKKQIVNTLVRQVTIDRDRELHVEIAVNLLALLDKDPSKRGQNWQVGTYSRTRSSLFHPHHSSSCG